METAMETVMKMILKTMCHRFFSFVSTAGHECRQIFPQGGYPIHHASLRKHYLDQVPGFERDVHLSRTVQKTV
jgi:hypothetical protein